MEGSCAARRSIWPALRVIDTAPTADGASAALDAFAAGAWGQRFPTLVKMWRQAWTHVIPFFAFPPDVRRVIYTTNALESVHARVRKIIKTRGHFPNDEAATTLIWLALRNITQQWSQKAGRHWRAALDQNRLTHKVSDTPAPGHFPCTTVVSALGICVWIAFSSVRA